MIERPPPVAWREIAAVAPGHAVVVALSVDSVNAIDSVHIESLAAVLADRVALSHGPGLLDRRVRATRREAEILEQFLRGRSVVQIAATLGKSPYTVIDHLKSLRRKFGIHSARDFFPLAMRPAGRSMPIDSAIGQASAQLGVGKAAIIGLEARNLTPGATAQSPG